MELSFVKILQLIASLSILIVMHEFGHFFFARLFRMRVEKFYLFFNPSFSIFKCRKSGGKWHFAWFSSNDKPLPAGDAMQTEWGIGWLPLGGYCRISGMIDESLDSEAMKSAPQPWEYRSHPAWHRLLVVSGGVAVNFVLALCLYCAVMFTWGESYVEMRDTVLEFSATAKKAGFRDGDKVLAADGVSLGKFTEENLLSLLEAHTVTVLRAADTVRLTMPEGGLIRPMMRSKEAFAGVFVPPVVDSVMASAPAHGLLLSGDRFLQIGDSAVNTFAQLAQTLSAQKTAVLPALVERGGDTLALQIPLTEDGKIGFYVKNPLEVKTRTFGFLQSIPAGISHGCGKLAYYVRQMKFVFTREGAENIGGLGTLGSMFPSYFDWHTFWEMTAFLSIVLAFMNVLPIPALDGGFILILLYEIIFRRKPSEKFLMRAQIAGMAFLFALFVYANGMDLLRFSR